MLEQDTEDAEKNEEFTRFASVEWQDPEVSSSASKQNRVSDANETEIKADSRVIMSVVYHQRRLGVAIFYEDENEISVTEVWENEDDFSSLQLIKFQVNPTLIVTCSFSGNQKFLNALKCKLDDNTEGFDVQIIKASNYLFEAAKHKLLLLELQEMPKEMITKEKLFYLSSITDFNNIQMIRSVGGLISYLLKNRIVNELEGSDEMIKLNAITSFSMDSIVCISLDTMKAIGVFSDDLHPSAHGIGKAKEGLSLYSLFKTRTPLGKALLRKWFLRPQLDQNILSERHEHVHHLLEPQNAELVYEFSTSCLKHVKDIPRILHRIKMVCSSVSDWYNLYQTLLSAVRIKELCSSMKTVPIFNKVRRGFDDSLYEIVEAVASVVDFDESKFQGRLCIKACINEELDELRRNYENLDDILTPLAKEEMMKITDPRVTCLTIVYYPQVGYQIVLPRKEDIPLNQQIQIQGFDFQFSTNKFIYFKNPFMIELDQSTELGDIWGRIIDIENQIILQVEQLILAKSSLLLSVANILAELDCYIAFAIAAQENRWIKPKLTQQNIIEIKNGRHPIHELCVGTFIPNDTLLVDGQRIKMISGANGSGKSVYLKQVALIIFMAHVGSYVPAEEATIGPTDRIFARIYSRETVSVQSSSFMIDLQQVSTMLRHSTERSLLLLDEFGKGTNVIEGVSILGATIKYLQEQDSCPKTFISTHFIEYFDNTNFLSGRELSFQHMDIFFKETDEEMQETIFLYKLVSGSAKNSYGHAVAQQAGIPASIVSRGIELKDKLSRCQVIEPLVGDSPRFLARNEEYKAICAKFLNFECENGDVQALMNTIFQLRTEE